MVWVRVRAGVMVLYLRLTKELMDTKITADRAAWGM